MRFKKIELENYRQYKSLKFDFSKNKSTDLHVIIGQNGIGKTNLLNAITWCLYGIEPHLGDQSKSLPIFNLDAKKEAKTNGVEMIDVVVRIIAETEGKSVRFERSVKANVMTDFTFEDQFMVLRYDDKDNVEVLEQKDALSFVNRYMPESIREYFYFDGEQLHNYFLNDENTRIKDTVYSISQVDMLTTIQDRLGKVILNKERQAGKLSPDISKLNVKIDDTKKNMELKTKTIKELSDQIKLSKNIVDENSKKLQGIENVSTIESEYKSLVNQKNKLENKKKELIYDLTKFIQNARINLTFYPVAKESLRIIKEKEDKGMLPPNIDRGILNEMLSSSKCYFCDRELGDDVLNNIQQILDRIQVSSETSNLLMSIKSELCRVVEETSSYQDNKSKLLDSIRDNEQLIEKNQERLNELEHKLNSFSDREQVKLWHEERKEHQRLIESNQEKLGVEKNTYSLLNVECRQLEINLNEALNQEIKCISIKKEIEFLKKSKTIIEKIEKELISSVKEKMERRTTDLFKDLIWKENTYSNITLDDSYQLELIHVDGYPCIGSCSAAERSLLALSFTLALHEVSGFKSLLFIDTPVARVSGINRRNFSDVLKEVSQDKQIIMTFTPDEYSKDVSDVFQNDLSTYAKLNTNNEVETYIGGKNEF